MLSHVMVGSNDLEKSKTFYDAVLGALGVPPAQMAGHRMFYRTSEGMFGVTTPIDGQPATHANGGTVAFVAKTPEEAKAWHDAGVANGGKSIEDPPGVRDMGGMKLYLAYLRDPDGNKICAMHRM